MNSKFAALLAECKSYLILYQRAKKEGTVTPQQTEYYNNIKTLLPLLQDVLATAKAKEQGAAIAFSELYNKNFDYLNKFTSIPQSSIKHILAYQQIAEKLSTLYAKIAPETIQRQGSILVAKKKAVDKWLLAFQEQLSSSANQASLEKRFQELLEKANAALSIKGLEPLAMPTNTTT